MGMTPLRGGFFSRVFEAEREDREELSPETSDGELRGASTWAIRLGEKWNG